MSEKTMILSEKFFEKSLEKDAEVYRTTGNVISLLNTVLEAITESIPNIGISIMLKHDFECYFFTSGNVKEALELHQIKKNMIPFSFELKDGNNRFFINHEKLILEVMEQGKIRKMNYNCNSPEQLVIRDFEIDGKKEMKTDEIISNFNEDGYEQQRIHQTYCKRDHSILNRFRKQTKPISTLREWFRNPNDQQKVVVTICDVYDNGKEKFVKQIGVANFEVSCDDIYIINHDGLGEQMVDLEKYNDPNSYLLEENHVYHKIK